jgi:hypothetical protein
MGLNRDVWKAAFRREIWYWGSVVDPERRGKYISVTISRHHHHHVHERLGVFPVPWSRKRSWSLRLFLGRPMFLRPFGLYRSACIGVLFVFILCTCCSHFFWYSFISLNMFCAPVFFPFSLSNFVIPSKCLKNFICVASKLCSFLFFSTQSSALKLGPFS